ncbi:hypothetical protein ABD86_22300 [Paenibacillus alvei]|nr:hypothetical protein [Paenibacillus alvei]MBG9746533.1 hypothetical protein [Paenibacillus alvei]
MMLPEHKETIIQYRQNYGRRPRHTKQTNEAATRWRKAMAVFRINESFPIFINNSTKDPKA